MTTSYPIRIFYPQTSGRIVLHTDLGWDDELAATQVGDGGTRWEFAVSTDKPYLYFKPCLRDDDGTLHWAVGSNYLLVTTAPEARDVYPHFHGGQSGDISPSLSVPGAAGQLIRIYQPPGYRENTLKRYPVLYMHDGENLFFPDEAFLGEDWEVGATMDLLDAMNVIDKVIVVGIYSRDRMNEYTKPGYEEYARIIVDRIKPMVESGFRTLGGPEHTAVMGSSLGGVVSFYLGWQRPDVFGMAGCMSSTFGYRDDFFARVASEPKRNVRFYLDSGWPEDNFEPTQSMRDLLFYRGYQSGRDLMYFAFPNQAHNERFWASRSHIPFQFFFGKTPTFG